MMKNQRIGWHPFQVRTLLVARGFLNWVKQSLLWCPFCWVFKWYACEKEGWVVIWKEDSDNGEAEAAEKAKGACVSVDESDRTKLELQVFRGQELWLWTPQDCTMRGSQQYATEPGFVRLRVGFHHALEFGGVARQCQSLFRSSPKRLRNFYSIVRDWFYPHLIQPERLVWTFADFVSFLQVQRLFEEAPQL